MYVSCATPRSFSGYTSGLNVNIFENDKEMLLEAALPGRKREELTLEVSEKVLTIKVPGISVEREGFQLEYSEHSRGDLERSFKLGPNLDTTKIQARFENGLLLISIPKQPEAQSRKVEIG
ncbi:MAG: Hsp20/alpha crystallin family protein [candidate division FCPU426 bacterium]